MARVRTATAPELRALEQHEAALRAADVQDGGHRK
jgi:hypothetical protein